MKSKILMMMIYSFIFFLLNVAPSLQVRFSVIGQDLPLVIPPGEDAVLPCHLSPQINAENMTIRWFKDKYQDLAHLYQGREDRLENQMAEYRSRTTLIKDGIITGSVILIIHNVRPSDSGLYTCFYHSESFYEEAVVELKVAALGSKPHIYLEDFQNGGITVVCESSGWYPKPDALWKDEDGNNISSSTEVKARDGSLQFHVKATYIFNGHPSTLSCCVRNPLLSEWKQSTVHITDAFIHRISSCMLSCLLISASFTLLGILLISCTFFLFNEQRELSEELGKLSEELGKLSEEREKPSEEDDLILFTVDNKDVCRSGFPPASYDDNYKARAVALGTLGGLSHVVFSPDYKMYAVIGSAIYVGPMPSNPSKNWLMDTAKRVGITGWEGIKCLFFHPNGTLFAVTQEGAFYKGPPPTNENVSWLDTQATNIGAGGWNEFHALFFDPNGILHAVAEDKLVKNSPPTSPDENWLEGCQTIGKYGWSMLNRFMSFSPDGKLWCVSNLGGFMFAAYPPPDQRDNWIGRAEFLGPGYVYKFMAFTRSRTSKSDYRRSTSPLNSVFTCVKSACGRVTEHLDPRPDKEEAKAIAQEPANTESSVCGYLGLLGGGAMGDDVRREPSEVKDRKMARRMDPTSVDQRESLREDREAGGTKETDPCQEPRRLMAADRQKEENTHARQSSQTQVGEKAETPAAAVLEDRSHRQVPCNSSLLRRWWRGLRKPN